MSISVVIFGQSAGAKTLETGGTVLDILTTLGLSSQEYIVAVRDQIVPVDFVVEHGDEVVLFRMVSGG